MLQPQAATVPADSNRLRIVDLSDNIERNQTFILIPYLPPDTEISISFSTQLDAASSQTRSDAFLAHVGTLLCAQGVLRFLDPQTGMDQCSTFGMVSDALPLGERKSVLGSDAVLVGRIVKDVLEWTTWTMQYKVLALGSEPVALALQNDPNLVGYALGHAAVEDLQRSLQLAVDLSIMEGSMDEQLGEIFGSKVVSSPTGKELEYFGSGLVQLSTRTKTSSQDHTALRWTGSAILFCTVLLYSLLVAASARRRQRRTTAAATTAVVRLEHGVRVDPAPIHSRSTVIAAPTATATPAALPTPEPMQQQDMSHSNNDSSSYSTTSPEPTANAWTTAHTTTTTLPSGPDEEQPFDCLSFASVRLTL